MWFFTDTTCSHRSECGQNIGSSLAWTTCTKSLLSRACSLCAASSLMAAMAVAALTGAIKRKAGCISSPLSRVKSSDKTPAPQLLHDTVLGLGCVRRCGLHQSYPPRSLRLLNCTYLNPTHSTTFFRRISCKHFSTPSAMADLHTTATISLIQ